MTPPDTFPAIVTPMLQLEVGGIIDAILSLPLVKALVPLPVILAVAPFVWLLFRDTWSDIDAEARAFAKEQTGPDHRPAVALVLLSLTLSIQEYYGGRGFFQQSVEPLLERWETGGAKWLKFAQFRDLYSYGWWVFARVLGYAIVPLVVWKTLFPKDSVLDMGLRIKGFFSHL